MPTCLPWRQSNVVISEDTYNYSPKEAEREKRREKKKRPRMVISGRSVIGLAGIIARRAKEAGKKQK